MKQYDAIRCEAERDYREVEQLIRDAFWNLNTPGCGEHYYAHLLRQQPDFLPELDLVLEKDGVILANVMYHKAVLQNENGDAKEILTFGPLSVLPAFQRQGLSRILLEESFRRARKLGWDTVVIFGNPENYVSRGFVSCKKRSVSLEGGFFPAAMLVKELREGALSGHSWVYDAGPAEQELSSEGLEAFDRLFPPAEKAWQPSQEAFYIRSHSLLR